MKVRIKAGRMVHKISISWPSRRDRLDMLLKMILNIMYPTKIVMIIKIRRVWSWKKIICSITGDEASISKIFDDVAIRWRKS